MFVCGTLNKFKEDGTFISSSLFVARVDPDSGKTLNYLNSWGNKYPNAVDICKKLEYDKKSDQVVMFSDVRSEDLQEKCKLKGMEGIPELYDKCSLIIVFKPGIEGQLVDAYNIRQERPGFGIMQNDMTYMDDYIYFVGEFFNHTTFVADD